MKSTFLPDDVTLLLKDITGLVPAQPAAERERLIQRGAPYYETLPVEYAPTAAYLKQYSYALENFKRMTADAAARLAQKIWADTGEKTVLVSLARAGVCAGILVKRYLSRRYGVSPPHYSLSILRGGGVDKNAMRYILDRHDAAALRFVDGWTGKGAISRELESAIADYPGVCAGLCVLADPARLARLRGSAEDFLIASSCLNAPISGLISRTLYRPDIIGPEDFHGAAFFGHLAGEDRTYEFINAVEACFDYGDPPPEREETPEISGFDETRQIAARFGISNINFVKPGIGETTRVLLRRAPERVLVKETANPALTAHIIQLAAERGVPVSPYPLVNYNSCGIIKALADI
ncbi:MAG: cysteine protease StiP family protein [Clostridiales bacterium]|jgi:hypothetical protein|nr:cysteine protease StiP family protein [Clostridiales bacterium]